MAERIETLNRRLIDHFGLDTSTNQPMFRIVWSDDQTEKRFVRETPEGLQLLYPILKEVKKYSYIEHLYVLERLVLICEPDMPDVQLSYEPIWVYCDDKRNPLPPHWDATKLVVDTLYAALGKKSLAKYKEDAESLSQEARDERIKKTYEELFGNETAVGDALSHKYGIVVPGGYMKVEGDK